MDKRIWINVLPMGKWMAMENAAGLLEVTFRLKSYQIIDGVPKYQLETTGGGEAEGGILEVILSKNLSTRLYVPVELHRVPGIGLSPKLVYRLPKDYRIVEFDSGNYKSPQATFYDKARQHTMTTIKG